MFEEICLSCGKPLNEDGRAYCSDECQNIDIELHSPSRSSHSSAFSSPYLDVAPGGDVPALVPSALGYHHNYDSSSSASSTSWSATDDEYDDYTGGMGSDTSFHDSDSIAYENTSKSPNGYPLTPSRMAFVRRPSGTNNRSMVPYFDKRTPSSSYSASHSVPVPYPLSSPEDDSFDFDTTHTKSNGHPQSAPGHHADSGAEVDSLKDGQTITKPHRNRNRASLPAYFSLLQMPSMNTSTSQASSSKPDSASSAQRAASPTTPKLSFAGLAPGGVQDSSDMWSKITAPKVLAQNPSRIHARRVTTCPPPSKLEQSMASLTLGERGSSASGGHSQCPPESDNVDGQLPAVKSAHVRGRFRLDELGGDTEYALGYGARRSDLLHRERERQEYPPRRR